MPYACPVPTCDSHQRRATEADGTIHAARSAGGGFTTACAIYPAPEVERLEFTPRGPVTCDGCLTVLKGPESSPYEPHPVEGREPCGEGHCRCCGVGPEHADCACSCDCPRDEDGQLIDD